MVDRGLLHGRLGVCRGLLLWLWGCRTVVVDRGLMQGRLGVWLWMWGCRTVVVDRGLMQGVWGQRGLWLLDTQGWFWGSVAL